ncbi:MAG: hypothetical protein ACXWQO_18240 [Bdellovibrionota bacterium]
MKYLILTALFLISTHAYAQNKFPDRECLDEANSKMLLKSFNVNLGQRTNDICNPKTRAYNVLEALNFIYALYLDPKKKVPAPYNQNLLGKDWIGRLWELAPNILWGPTVPNNDCAHAYAFAGPYPYNLQMLYICPKIIEDAKDGSSVLTMVDTLLHETRHLQGGNGYLHVPCKGEKKGSQGCDPSAGYKGAYAVEMEANAKIGVQGVIVHPALRYYAKRLAYVDAQERFRIPAAVYEEGTTTFLAHSENGEILQIDETGHAKKVLEGQTDGHLYRMNDMDFAFVPNYRRMPMQGFARYNLDQVDPTDDDSDPNPLTTLKFFQEYNAASAKDRENFKDFTYTESMGGYTRAQAVISGDSIHLYLAKMSLLEDAKSWEETLKLPSGVPTRFFPVLDGEGGIFVLNEKQELFRISILDKGQAATVAPATSEFSKYLDATKAMRSGRIFVLDKDHHLLEHTANGDLPVKGLEKRTFSYISDTFFHHPETPTALDDPLDP